MDEHPEKQRGYEVFCHVFDVDVRRQVPTLNRTTGT